MRTTTTDEGEDDIMNPIYELTDHAHSEEELAPWLDACGTGRETIDGLLLTALDCAWGNWKAAAKPPMHPYANPAYLRAAETSPWRWDDCLPAGHFTYGLDTEQWHRIIAAMNEQAQKAERGYADFGADEEDRPPQDDLVPEFEGENDDY